MFCSGFYVLRSRPQIGVTFAIVFGVIFYRISTKAALHMSPNPITRSHVQLTVKTTAAIINLVVILILDEVYGAVARWLTVLGESTQSRDPRNHRPSRDARPSRPDCPTCWPLVYLPGSGRSHCFGAYLCRHDVVEVLDVDMIYPNNANKES